MAKKKATARPQSRELGRDDLQLALKKLDRRIADLIAFDVDSINDQFDANASALVARINASIAEIFGQGTVEYSHNSVWSLSSGAIHAETDWGGGTPIGTIRDEYRKGVANTIVRLNGLKATLQERLDDMPSMPGASPVSGAGFERTRVDASNRKVFIVHGHDEAAKQSVARYLTKLELEPVILHEHPSKGRTIIEKLEAHLGDVAYVIVLLTPDDIAAPVNSPDNKSHRARQNVILELGLFIGALGRDRVCALYKSDVEIPSDYDGVVFVSMDGGGWQLEVAKELRAAGLDVDFNKLG